MLIKNIKSLRSIHLEIIPKINNYNKNKNKATRQIFLPIIFT